MPTPWPASRRATLRALCDAFVPHAASEGGAEALYARVEALISAIDDPRSRGQLELLLGLFGNPVGNLLFSGRPRSVVAMDQGARVAMLRDLGASSLTARRAAFQAFKKIINLAYYAWPLANGAHPAWREAGYPGPLPHRSGEPNHPLPVLEFEADTTLDCDVVVIGSGAGGGVVAGVLAQAGRSVVVLEKGEQRLPRDFSHVEGEGLGDNYLDKGLLANASGTLPVLAGSALGGGTVINYTTCFELPDVVAREWRALSGLDLFEGARLKESFARVSERIHVTSECSAPGNRDAILAAGCAALGWHHEVIRRNVRGCPGQAECGYCGYGCRHGAKQTTAITYLSDAARAGARIVVRCDAERVLVERGRAAGVTASVRRADGTRVALTVRAKIVVAACGAIHTPALLARSGLMNGAIGRGLRLHPATAVGGFFDQRVDPWTGHQQTRYSDQFADQGDGYGAKFETASVGFALPATAFGWEGPDELRAVLRRLGHVSIVGILARDRDAGRVVSGRDGRPHIHYELSPHTIARVRAAMRGGAELLASQGAREVFTIQQPPVRVTPGGAGWLDRFMHGADARGYDRARQTFITFHQMASCAMGRDPRTSVVGENGESHEVRGLYVADGSVFPTSSGVNPMLTIMAVADHIARGIAGE